MIRIFTTLVLAMLAFSTLVYGLAASSPPASAGQPTVDALLMLPASLEAMPPPSEPLDETPITPVESTGAPMWP